ncbi:hypothetical protein L7F22_043583 [Adiantum nelumboides]|nr:hypothetical protein [Adiantum nelumboides]
MATTTAITPGRLAAFAWHGVSLVILTYALRRLPIHANISGFNIEEQFGSHYQFLTVLGLWFSRLTTLFALSSDIYPSSAGMRKFKTMLMALTMPAEVLISLLYWPILLLDPSLLIPPRKVMNPDNPAQLIWETVRLPLLDDLSFHAAPAIFLVLDYLIFEPPFPKEIHPAAVSALSTAAYGIWVEICANKNGNYPYPLLGILSNAQRVGLYSVCAILFVGITTSVTLLHKAIDKAYKREWDQVAGIQGKGFVGAIDAKQSSRKSAAKKSK